MRLTSRPQPHDAGADAPVRHPGDVVRVAIGSTVLLGCAVLAWGGRHSRAEDDLFALVNRLPELLRPALDVAMQPGAFGAIFAFALVALLLRRWRLARDLLLSGVGAWLAAKLLKALVDRERPAPLLEHVIVRDHAAGLGLPSGHAAVAAALATAAAPYLPRWARRSAWVVVVAVAVARVYVGAHFPLDVLAGAALGWTVGSLVHLAFGAPAGRPSTGAIADSLRDAGFPVTAVHPAATTARPWMPYRADTSRGPALFVKVVGADERDGDVLVKLYRNATRRDVGDEMPFASRRQLVEHEAYVTLLAEQAGVRTAHLLGTASTSVGDELLVWEHLGLVPLEGELTDEQLDQLLGEVALLQAAHIAHRDLRLTNVATTKEGEIVVLGFAGAQVAAPPDRLAADVAAVLASLALVVGVDRAVAAVQRVLGSPALASAVPLLQPLALPRETRAAYRRHHALKELRVATAAAAGVEDVQLEPLARIRPHHVVLLVVLGVLVHVVLTQLGELERGLGELRHANPAWITVAFVLSACTYFASALAFLGTTNARLPLARTTAVELASSFANRVTPASVGGMGVNIRYFQRSGLTRADAVSSVALNSAAGFVMHLSLMALTFLFVRRTGGLHLHVPAHALLLGGIVVGLVAAGVAIALTTKGGRRRVLHPVVEQLRHLGAALSRPVKAVELFGGAAAITMSYIGALACALAAFGAHVPIAHVAAVFLVGAALASAAPTPGGLGAVEAALVVGLTATGVAEDTAIAAVLAYRLVTFWAPILPGWLAYRKLLAHHAL